MQNKNLNNTNASVYKHLARDSQRQLSTTHTIQLFDQKPNAEWGSQTLRQACYRENPESAMCVQNFNDSRGLAIRITYRISLRSSSLWEPRHPSLKVVLDWFPSGRGASPQLLLLSDNNNNLAKRTTQPFSFRSYCQGRLQAKRLKITISSTTFMQGLRND